MSQTPGGKLMNNGRDFTATIHKDTYEFIDPTKLNLQGKHVLVTGASKGLGRAVALSFAKAGASAIAIAARSDVTSLVKEMESAAEQAGRPKPNILPLSIDVTDQKSVETAAQILGDSFKTLDIIINNAGAMEDPVKMLDIDPKIWWRTWETNILGPFLILRAFMPYMIASASPDKTVLTYSSVGGHRIAHGLSAYQTGKMAVCRLMEFVCAEYGEQGVLAYSAHPGSVQTAMGSRLPENIRHMLQDTPELAGDATVWLVSERRNWLAGRYVSCAWDMKELLEKREVIEKGDLLKFRMAVELGQ